MLCIKNRAKVEAIRSEWYKIAQMMLMCRYKKLRPQKYAKTRTRMPVLTKWNKCMCYFCRQNYNNRGSEGLYGGRVKPNTHRRRDETVLSRRVGVGGVYMNSQLAHDDCWRIRRCERSRWPWPSLQFCSQCYRSRIWRNMWRCVFVNIRICCVV